MLVLGLGKSGMLCAAAARDALGADLTVAPVDAGHMVYLERPAEVAALLREFLG